MKTTLPDVSTYAAFGACKAAHLPLLLTRPTAMALSPTKNDKQKGCGECDEGVKRHPAPPVAAVQHTHVAQGQTQSQVLLRHQVAHLIMT